MLRHKFDNADLGISGPPKTADIEQTLVDGVHGPKQLVLFLIDDLRTKT